LRKLGADQERIMQLKGVTLTKEEDKDATIYKSITLKMVDVLENTVAEHGVKLLIVDPLQAIPR
jgi:hypothetical protein